MAEGTVTWYDEVRRYGFIAPDGGGQDVRVHYLEIQTNAYKTLEEGDRVSFDVEYGVNGPHAVKVTPLGDKVAPGGMPTLRRDPNRIGYEPSSLGGKIAMGAIGLLAGAALIHFIIFIVLETLSRF